LEEFSKSLSKNKIVAVRVADDEATIEGGIWLALMDGKAEVLAKDELHAGQLFEKGWTVARGHWFSLKRVLLDSRIYCALEQQTFFNVQSMIRLDNGPEQVGCSSARLAVVQYCTRLREFTLSNDVLRLPAVGGEQPLALGLGTRSRLRV
jgi:hypothetical protein